MDPHCHVFFFPEVVAEKILSIPLAEKPHDDFQVRSAEASGEFTVRSAYQLLQNSENNPRAYALQDDYKDFYKKLWLLDLPSKIKITVWKISWNFLATRVNMLIRRLTNFSVCPRCGSGPESMNHLFRECPSVLLYGSSGVIGITDCIIKGVNFDAAYEKGQNKAAIGVVARDKEGLVLVSCSEVHQRVSSAFGAEAMACRKALQIGVHKQWERVIIEGDSLVGRVPDGAKFQAENERLREPD